MHQTDVARRAVFRDGSPNDQLEAGLSLVPIPDVTAVQADNDAPFRDWQLGPLYRATLDKGHLLLPELGLSPMQLAQGAGVRQQHAPPHHRADPEQPNLDLNDAGRVRTGRFGVRVHRWFGLLCRSGHRDSLPQSALSRPPHPTLPHGPAAQRGVRRVGGDGVAEHRAGSGHRRPFILGDRHAAQTGTGGWRKVAQSKQLNAQLASPAGCPEQGVVRAGCGNRHGVGQIAYGAGIPWAIAACATANRATANSI